jgi:DNA-directed RNA polymerase specialized sigma24 family protein
VTDAERKFHANLGVIYQSFRRLGYRHESRRGYDDAEQVALVAGWRACVDHDPARGAITTVITKYVTRAILNHRAREGRAGRTCGMVCVPEYGKTLERSGDVDWIPDDRDDERLAIEDAEDRERKLTLIREAARHAYAASPMHRHAIDLLALGLPNDEVSDICGASYGSISNYRTRFYRDVRQALSLDAKAGKHREEVA